MSITVNKSSELVLSAIRSDAEYKQLLDAVNLQRRARPKPVVVSGLCEGAGDALCAALAGDLPGGRPVLILCPDEKTARRMRETVNAFGLRCAYYPNRDLNMYNISASREFEQARLSLLVALRRGELDVVTTTPEAALSYTIPQGVLAENLIRVGMDSGKSDKYLARRRNFARRACKPTLHRGLRPLLACRGCGTVCAEGRYRRYLLHLRWSRPRRAYRIFRRRDRPYGLF